MSMIGLNKPSEANRNTDSTEVSEVRMFIDDMMQDEIPGEW